jgi:hypothetical protein
MWRSVNVPGIGFLSTIDAKLSEEQSVGRIKFPDLRRSDRLLIVSDYAGDHESSKFETYSYLILAIRHGKNGRRGVVCFRRPIDLTKRRISYERLCDKERQRVLPLLLLAAGSVEGLSLTIVISKSAGSLFVRSDSAQAAALRERFGVWKPQVWERALRVTTFAGLLIAGLSAPGQDIFWISDQDPISSNKERLNRLTEILAMISSNLLPHNLGHLRCGTTEIDDGMLNVEDLASIPDLVAGSAAALHTRYSEQGVQLTSVIAPAPAALGWRAHAVLDWLADKRLPLTRVMLLIESIGQGGKALSKARASTRYHGCRVTIRCTCGPPASALC